MTDYPWTYVAGPMTGYPEWNEPAFVAMATRLRDAGLLVISPNELHPADAAIPHDWYLRRDLAELVKCRRVVFLPGWERSKGARLEHQVAEGLGLELVYPHELETFMETIGCTCSDDGNSPCERHPG